ncbi:MAG: hypothetical protein ACFE8U_08235 [Candidatus Hermodarchaeota archaeon]
MRQNLIAIAGLSHSGKDLLFGQIMKLGSAEPDLKITQNVIYYDWITNPSKKHNDSYVGDLLSAVSEKLLMKLKTLIYIHDITYQRLDDTIADFQQIVSNIQATNKRFQVVLLLNRSHLITNEIERDKVRNLLLERLQHVFPQEIQSYVVSLKGPEEQRRTNLIFTQIVNKAVNFENQSQKAMITQPLQIKKLMQDQLQHILSKKMEEIGFSGAYVLSSNHEILFAIGKSKGWQEKIGPQIIRMLDQNEAFDTAPKEKTNIIRIEDFLMVTQTVTPEIKLILIGSESNFRLQSETYLDIEQICLDLANKLDSKLK